MRANAGNGSRLGYRPCLDGLRAFAVLMVMGHHAYLKGFDGGQIGVDLFFVLSGFLITNILIQEWDQTSRVQLKYFYGRRALRLLPALFSLLFVSEVFALVRLRGPYFWLVQKAIVAAACYVANWMRVHNIESMGPLAHTWSLSVEEQFYFLWPPLLVFMLPRLKKKYILGVVILLLAFVAICRAHLWMGEASWDRIYNGTDTRFDELLSGSAAAFVFAFGWLQNPPLRALMRWTLIPSALFIAALVIWPMSDPSMVRYGWLLIEMAVVIIISWLVSNSGSPFHRVLEFPAIVWIGKISYGLYLWHAPIFSQAGGLPFPWVLRILVMFTVTFTVAALCFRWIETPFLKLKSRIGPSGRV